MGHTLPISRVKMQRPPFGSTDSNISFIPSELRVDVTDLGDVASASTRCREPREPEGRD